MPPPPESAESEFVAGVALSTAEAPTGAIIHPSPKDVTAPVVMAFKVFGSASLLVLLPLKHTPAAWKKCIASTALGVTLPVHDTLMAVIVPATVHRPRMMTRSMLSLIHISEPTRQAEISYAVFCLKK